MKDIIQEIFLESAEVVKKSVQLSGKIEEAVIVICDCIKNGNRVYKLPSTEYWNNQIPHD